MELKSERRDDWSNLLSQVGKQRDRSAFKELFKHFAPLIKGYSLSKMPAAAGPHGGDELVQEVMLKVWQKAPYFDPRKAAASTWIYTIARNCRIDLLRRGAKHQSTSLAADDVWQQEDENEPYSLLQHTRNQDSIRSSFRELPPEQSHILTKVYMEGKSHAEVAQELDLPLGTVKSRVRLAIKKLQVLITAR
ncbi:sigma-70 family RNA polymerase sigma factor [Exilibacterium tricleocarpae]|uniref:Sigma-70 family RNA polymerase sigma factor n=1 Tax=Exilibacterium tricleocarpae TaxID=2591008 RepID=A0A545TS73_9GAMM|nr:sigma-70 family RNA polymerase sigma factor [Exilibacterium tricleocarpae]TQV80070.1 sigma-70 family RNA polymerase sigma factor [Exilibacterium tricleocarpae]